MSTLHYWHRGAIGCFPGAGPSSAFVGFAADRFVFRVYALSSIRLKLKSPRRIRFHVANRVPVWKCSHDQRRAGEDYESSDGEIRQNAKSHCSTDMDTSSEYVPSLLRVLPWTAVVVALSRVAVLMAIFRKEFPSLGGTEARTKNADSAIVLVKEFVEAAKGNRPWRPGLEKALSQQGTITLAILSASAIAHDHLNPVIATLRANPTFMSGLIAWTIAQVAKVFTYYLVVRKWDFKMVMGSGGMPSSHSALCFALTTSVAFAHGVSDALFPVCLGFTLIVMYDAAGVRRHAGRQAEVLNMIVEDLFQGHPVSEKKLKELLGHTPLQVFAGATLGIVVGYFVSRPRLA